MKTKEEKRSRRLNFKVTPAEYEALKTACKSTFCRSLSDYVRSVLRREPVIKRYRNQSLDDFHLTAIGIKNEVEAIHRAFREAIERLKSLPADPHTKAAIEFLLAEAFDLKEKIDAIKSTLVKLYEKWSQK